MRDAPGGLAGLIGGPRPILLGDVLDGGTANKKHGSEDQSAPLSSHHRSRPAACLSASRAAPWTACQGMRSHADAVALVIDCSIPVV